MVDTVSKEKRSIIMSKIHSKDTKPEMLVRKYLYHLGYRYRKNYSRLPGKPDLYLKKYNTAIFINGCFWHAHEGCKYASIPKSNVKFWTEKLKNNKLRDEKNHSQLRAMGINLIVVWECDILYNFNKTMDTIVKELSID